jgi:hypothetical protein
VLCVIVSLTSPRAAGSCKKQAQQCQRVHVRFRAPARQQASAAYVSIRQHTSAYCSIRQHTVAHVSRRVAYAHCIQTYIHTYIYIYIHVQIAAQCTHLLLSPPPSTSAYVSIRQHTSAYLRIEAYVSIELTYRFVHLLARSVLILLYVPSY